jgi:hypothetical protein
MNYHELPRETGGLVHLGGSVSEARETVARSTDTARTRCSGDPGFSVHQVATGSLNDVRQCSPATIIPLSPPPPRHLHQVQTDASVTIRPLVLTPAQRVSHTSAETDVLQLKPAFMRQHPLVLTPAQRVSHTSAETDVLQLKPAFMPLGVYFELRAVGYRRYRRVRALELERRQE